MFQLGFSPPPLFDKSDFFGFQNYLKNADPTLGWNLDIFEFENNDGGRPPRTDIIILDTLLQIFWDLVHIFKNRFLHWYGEIELVNSNTMNPIIRFFLSYLLRGQSHLVNLFLIEKWPKFDFLSLYLCLVHKYTSQLTMQNIDFIFLLFHRRGKRKNM